MGMINAFILDKLTLIKSLPQAMNNQMFKHCSYIHNEWDNNWMFEIYSYTHNERDGVQLSDHMLNNRLDKPWQPKA